MKKKIPCPDCKGTGGRTVMTGIRTDPCGVAFERCQTCDGNGIISVDATRADRIRAMSDEELAAYWADHYDEFCPCLEECGDALNQNQEIPAEKCIGCTLRWLQEVEP